MAGSEDLGLPGCGGLAGGRGSPPRGSWLTHLMAGPLAQPSPGRQCTHTQHPRVVSAWPLGLAHRMVAHLRASVTQEQGGSVPYIDDLTSEATWYLSARLCSLRLS